VYRVPNSLFDFLLIFNNLLNKETRVKTLILCINNIDTRLRVTVVQSDIGGEHVVSLLLKLKEMRRRVKSALSFWKVLVGPRGSVRIAITVVLMLQKDFSATLISLDILKTVELKMKVNLPKC
jgi:hypothetical protein